MGVSPRLSSYWIGVVTRWQGRLHKAKLNRDSSYIPSHGSDLFTAAVRYDERERRQKIRPTWPTSGETPDARCGTLVEQSIPHEGIGEGVTAAVVCEMDIFYYYYYYYYYLIVTGDS